MTDRRSDARSLVARARVHEGPSAQDRARIRARLEPAWALGAQVGSSRAGIERARIERSGSEASAALGGSGTRAVVRRLPIAKTLVLLAVASWSPSQPSAAGEHAPVRSELAIATALPAAQSGFARMSAPGTHDAAIAGPSQPLAAVIPTPASRKTSGHVPPLRMRASGAGVHATLARERATDFDGHSGAESTQSNDRHELSSRSASSPPSSGARASSATPIGGVGFARTGGSRAPTSRPDSATLTLVTPLNRAAPTQSSTEFKAQPIDDELAWIGAAQEALQNHQPSRALRLVEQHAFRFPDGALTQERLVVHTLALCALERFSAARRMLEVLAERAPDAPIVARVRSTCGL